MDAVSIHPYRYPAKPEGLNSEIVNLQNLIKKYNEGKAKPIWITEIGWPTHKDVRGIDENTRVEYLVRSHRPVLSEGVEKIFWYDFMNDCLDETYNEYNFRIIVIQGIRRANMLLNWHMSHMPL